MSFIGQILSFLWLVLPIALPLITGYVAWELWLQYVRKKFALANRRVLLEIRLPQIIDKSPLAMELVLTSLHLTNRETTWVDKYIKGQSRPYFSLELVSINGGVHFFIWTEAAQKNSIESQIYAQYPGVEVSEVPDYTQGIKYIPGESMLFGCEFLKIKGEKPEERGSTVIPIKTYIDFGMDKDPKEEVKIDPITPTLEFLGSLKEGEQVWIQIILKAHKKEWKVRDKKTGKRKKVDWQYGAEEQKQKILDALKNKDHDDAPPRRMTRGEEAVITAIERNVSKLPFDIGMRGIYYASKEAFRGAVIGGMLGSLRQYNTNNLNGFKFHKTTSFDFPWQDFRNIRLDKKKALMLKYFKRRDFFNLHSRRPFVMSTEELATMYHFPGGVASTPTFSRIMSKKSEPPANLPL